MKMSFNAKSRNAVHIQNVVKRYGGYFEHNPIGLDGKIARFSVVYESPHMDIMISIIQQPYF